MSSIDGTTPQTYEDELRNHYDPDRADRMLVYEQEILSILDIRMNDLRDIPHKDPVADIVFKAIGEARASLDRIEENLRKKVEAEKKKQAKAKPKPKPRAKPKTRKPRRVQVEEPVDPVEAEVVQ